MVIHSRNVDMWITFSKKRAEKTRGRRNKSMAQSDLMRLFSRYDSEINEGDFTPDELREYLAYAEGEEHPLSPAEWKTRYFEFYDDVKDKSLKRQDW